MLSSPVGSQFAAAMAGEKHSPRGHRSSTRGVQHTYPCRLYQQVKGSQHGSSTSHHNHPSPGCIRKGKRLRRFFEIRDSAAIEKAVSFSLPSLCLWRAGAGRRLPEVSGRVVRCTQSQQRFSQSASMKDSP